MLLISILIRPSRCRVFSQDIPTDVIIEVGEANFSLHKVRICRTWVFSSCFHNLLKFSVMNIQLVFMSLR